VQPGIRNLACNIAFRMHIVNNAGTEQNNTLVTNTIRTGPTNALSPGARSDRPLIGLVGELASEPLHKEFVQFVGGCRHVHDAIPYAPGMA